MQKIELKICVGTMCYIMGGVELRAVVESLPEDIRQHILVTYSPCLGTCNDKHGDAPYIQINGRTIAGVSKANLTQIIKEELNHVV